MTPIRNCVRNNFVYKPLSVTVCALALAVTAAAQTSAPGQAVKVSGSMASQRDFRFATFSIQRTNSPGTAAGLVPNGYQATGMSLWELLMLAYDSRPPMYWRQIKIENAPDWLGTEYYSIDAKVAEKDLTAWLLQDPTHHELLSAALRTALKERCKLSLRVVPGESQVYSLVVEKEGAKLTAASSEIKASPQGVKLPYGGVMTASSNNPNPLWTFHAATMQSLAAILTGAAWPFIVQDETGLTGRYDFTLQAQNEVANKNDPEHPGINWPIYELGLALKPDKAPSFSLVLDHIERPLLNDGFRSAAHGEEQKPHRTARLLFLMLLDCSEISELCFRQRWPASLPLPG